MMRSRSFDFFYAAANCAVAYAQSDPDDAMPVIVEGYSAGVGTASEAALNPARRFDTAALFLPWLIVHSRRVHQEAGHRESSTLQRRDKRYPCCASLRSRHHSRQAVVDIAISLQI